MNINYQDFFLNKLPKDPNISARIKIILVISQEESLLKDLNLTYYDNGNKFHNETLFDHLVESYKIGLAYTQDPVFAFGCLFHDIGKIRSKKYNIIKHDFTFHKHEYIGAKMVRDFMQNNNFRAEDTQRVYLMIKNHQYRIYPDTQDKTIRHWLREIGKQAWEDIRILRLVDRQANKANVMKPIIYKQHVEIDNRIAEQADRVFNENSIYRS